MYGITVDWHVSHCKIIFCNNIHNTSNWAS